MASEFRSKRISRSATITLQTPLSEGFPLFGPIREKDWASGWDPQILYPTNDLVEERMVFKTQHPHGHAESDFTWIVSRYLPEQTLIEYLVFTSERLWWITIQCREGIADRTTEADITYTYTGLTSMGNEINEKALQFMFAHNLQDWEVAINHYIQTGKKVEHP